MARKRTDPGTAEAPSISAVVTTATSTRIIELAAERGVSRSALARELLESALEALDEDAG